MIISWKHIPLSLTLALGICILGLDIGQTSHHRGEGIEGWEKGSVYNKLYNPADMDKLKGFVMDFRSVIPLPGMTPGIAMLVRGTQGEVVTVHLGPRSFIHLNSIKIRKGDKVTVKGVWAEIDGKNVFITSQVK
jgi:translation initiation factor IF-1